MICMGEAGMKRVLFKIIVPVLILVLWILMCYPVCQQENGFDYFLFWIMVGFPYGIRKMCMFLIPKNFGIAGSIGVLAFNGVIGGLIGGIIVIARMIAVIVEIIKMIAGTSGHNVQKLSCDFSDIAYLIHHIIPLKAESVAVLDVFFNVKLILFVIIG